LLGTVFKANNLSATYFYGIIPDYLIANVQRQLLKATRRVHELVTSDEEKHKLLRKLVERSRIKIIVAADKEVDSCKEREDSKTRRYKTRSTIAVI
jgi:hypothetical protein